QAVIRNTHIKRETATLMETMARTAIFDEVDAGQHIATAQARLEELAEMTPKEKGTGLVHMSEVLEGHVEELGERSKQKGMTGPPTVSKEMDKLTGGHQK